MKTNQAKSDDDREMIANCSEPLDLAIKKLSLSAPTSPMEEEVKRLEEERQKIKRDRLNEFENESTKNLYLSNEIPAGSGQSRLSVCSSTSDFMNNILSEDDNIDSKSMLSESTNTTADKSLTKEDNANGTSRLEHDHSKLDRFGFIIVNQDDDECQEKDSTRDKTKSLAREQERRGRIEARRSIKWVDMLCALEASTPNNWHLSHPKFDTRLIKGIPDCLRTKIWSLCLRVQRNDNEQSLEYRRLYLKISGFERQIDLDIERTLRDHILFKSRFSSAQVSLFKILVAYSNYDVEVGYCQGMSTVAAFLLLYFDEEMAYSMLCALMKRNNLRLMFASGFPLLFELFYIQEQLMKKYLPILYARLESFHITTSIYATKWYLTLFLGFPISLSTRIWDLFLCFGVDILVCISLALLKIYEIKLMSLEYEGCMQFLSKIPEHPIDERRLIHVTWKIWKKVNKPHKSFHKQRHTENKAHKNTDPFERYRNQFGKLNVDPMHLRYHR